MSKIENVVSKFGTRLTMTDLGWFDYDAIDADIKNPMWIYSVEGHTVLDGRLDDNQVVVVNPVTRQFWAVDLSLAAWIYEEEAPEGELLRRRLRWDKVSSASWLFVYGDRGAARHFDRDEPHTETTRLMAQDWSRSGAWEKYSR